ncbi:MAG: restriction endonuclease subunit S [Nostoc sp.]|uniref:restriction endonuclease subunit S n=1 Tax=Nostoc sp. TaxID=1180 RepID=UPI002FF922C2
MLIDKEQIAPSNWSYLPLQNVCEIIGVSQPPKEGFSYELKSGYVRLIQIQDYKSDKHKTYIPASLARRFCKEDDVMIGRYGPPIFQILRGIKGAYNVALMKAYPKNEKILDKKYLYYFLQNKTLLSYVISNSSRTAGQDGVRKELLDDYPILLPPLAEQKRIAAILEKSDRLRRTRRYALQLSDTFLQSVFLQMFGDNAQDFDVVEIEEIADDSRYALSSGPFGSNLTSVHYTSDGVPVLRGLNVTNSKLNLEDLKFISEVKAKDLERSEVKPGDIVVVAVGSSGLACQITEYLPRAIMSQNFNKITPNLNKINATYLEYCINSSIVQKQLQTEITDTVRSFLSLTKLKTIKLPLPSLSLQQKFAQIVQKFERLRTQQRESDRQAEHLFQTLLYRAFRGELTSSDFNDETVSVFSQEIPVQKPKPKSPVEVTEYLRTKVNQQETEAVQLTLPELE